MSAELAGQEAGSIKRTLTINVPKDAVDVLIEGKIKEVMQKARLPGFRPGKAPKDAIKKQFGASVRAEVLGQLIEQHYGEALKSHDLKPAGFPKINFVQNEAEQDFIFTAELEVFPEFKVQGLDAIEITKLKVEVKDQDLEKMLASLQKQHVAWDKTDRPAANEDRIIIDFEGFVDGQAFDNGKAEDFRLVLGSNTMIPGFEAGLIGKKAGEEFEISVAFPKDYHVPTLAGKEALFNIKLKEVSAPKLPELTDEFSKLFQVDSLEALKNEVRNNMERELEFNLKGRLKDQVTAGLLEHNKIQVPESLVAEETKRLSAQARERMKSWGHQNVPEMPLDVFTKEAEKRVALGLIMNQIIQEYELKADAERLKSMIEKMASVYENPEEVVKFFYQNKAKLAEMEQLVLEEQVVEKVIEFAKIKEEVKAFEAVMQQNQTASALPQG